MASSTLEQAVGRVEDLLVLPTEANAQPEASGLAMGVNLENESLEAVGMSDFSLFSANTELEAEAFMQASLLEVADDGEKFLRILYATRSVSKAIPQVKSHDQHNRMELYQKSVDMLEPIVGQMKAFMAFHQTAVDKLCQGIASIVTTYVQEKRDLFLLPNSLVMAFIKTFDILFTLDNLKNVKSAWNNDFSAYKRACSNLRKMSPDETMLQQQLYLFLANKNSIMLALKGGLENTPHYKDVMAHLMNIALELYEGEQYLLPDEKRSLLKMLTFGLPLMDGSNPQDAKMDDKLSILKVKKLKLDKIGRILSKLPVIHLLGDMQVSPSSYVKLAPHVDESKWSGEMDASETTTTVSAEYSAHAKLPKAREDYTAFMAELAVISPALRVGDAPDDLLKILLKGLRLLSNWTSLIQDQNAFKLGHPTDKYVNRDCPDDALPYEKAVRYNYRRADRLATVQFISMVKSLEARFNDLRALLGPLIRTHIHHDVQGIMHGVVQPLIQQSNKKKRKEASKILAVLFNMAADTDISIDHSAATSPTKKKKKKKSKTFELPEGAITLPTRNCSVSESQLFFMRGILGLLTNLQSASASKGLMKEKDFTSKQLADVNDFYGMSFFYKHLLDFEGTVRECADLSSLWFKEFYLELAKEIQFPTDMSLPWILTQQTMETPSMVEFVFYPIELYNDCAEYALYRLDSQCLYDEIEAEVNLCFDQLVFEIGQNVFQHYKGLATAALLNEANVMINDKTKVAPHHYEVIFRQRNVQVLGRAVDFQRLLTQSINALLRRNLDWIIGIFDSEDITSVIALEHMLQNAKLTHDMLAEHLDIDAWDLMLSERNQSTNPSSHYGRIEHKIIFELLYDFMPHFCYSSECQEFTRTPLPLSDVIERENAPKVSHALLYGSRSLYHATQQLLDGTKGRFTTQHAASIVRLVGPQKMGALINEFCQNIGLTLHTVVRPYYGSLMKGMPKEVKQPDAFYGTSGAFGYYQALLKPILQYPELSTEVYQVFRVIGNTMALVQHIENALDLVDVVDAILVNPFAKCPAPVRHLRMPTQEEVEQSQVGVGFTIKGGAEHQAPVVIAKVTPGSAAEAIGLRPGDEILACNNKAFKNPMTGEPITHASAVKFISAGAGKPMSVQNQQSVTYVETISEEVAKAAEGNQYFKERAMRSGPLSNPISVTGSVFRGALETLDKLLDSTQLRTTFLGQAPANNTMNMDTSEFHRFWSSMQFSYCTPTGNNLNSQSLFGEGLQWGGLTLVYLMGQAYRFEAMDYTYHILNIYDIDQKCEQIGAVKMEEFLEFGRYYRAVNDRVLNCLRIYYPEADTRTTRHGVCHPPRKYGSQGGYTPFEGEHAAAFGQSESMQMAYEEGESLV